MRIGTWGINSLNALPIFFSNFYEACNKSSIIASKPECPFFMISIYLMNIKSDDTKVCASLLNTIYTCNG